MNREAPGRVRTLQAVTREMVFEIVDRAEKDLNVKDEFLGHTYGIQILPIANLSQHV